jgi:hypothetical protein
MIRSRLLVLAALTGLSAPLALAAPASAARPTFETIHDDFDNDVSGFCGVNGLTVNVSGTFDSRLKIHSRHGTAYFLEHIRVARVFTGADPASQVTERTAFIQKDLKITDNGAGILTITTLATGPSTLYGPNGKAIARDPGQVRFRIVIDDNGTPDFFDDDIELSFVQVKGSTGRTDDYCEAMLPYLS